MMNILEQEDIIKGLPDQALMQEAQMPSGQVPQYLVVSEIQRRSDMRKRYKSEQKQMPQGTVKDKVMREGIMASIPPQMPPQMAMAPQMPQRMPQMPPQGIQQAMPPQMMFGGGVVRMEKGGYLDQQLDLLGKKLGGLGGAIKGLESGGSQEGADGSTLRSEAGALGVMQLMPKTAALPGYNIPSIFNLARNAGIEVNEDQVTFDTVKLDDGRIKKIPTAEATAEAARLLGNKKLNELMGLKYLEGMVNTFSGRAETPEDLVDLVGIAYNAGPEVAKAWDGNPATLNDETRRYIDRLGDDPDTVSFARIAGGFASDEPEPGSPEAQARVVEAIQRRRAASPPPSAEEQLLDMARGRPMPVVGQVAPRESVSVTAPRPPVASFDNTFDPTIAAPSISMPSLPPAPPPQPELSFVTPQEGPRERRESAQRGMDMMLDQLDQNDRQRRVEAVPELSKLLQDMGMDPIQAGNMALGIGPRGPVNPFGTPQPQIENVNVTAPGFPPIAPPNNAYSPSAAVPNVLLPETPSGVATIPVDLGIGPDGPVRYPFGRPTESGVATLPNGDARMQATDSAEVQSEPNSSSSVFSSSAGNLLQQSLDEAAGRRQAIVDFATGKMRYTPESIAMLEAEQAGAITRAERTALSGAYPQKSIQEINADLGIGPTGPASPFGTGGSDVGRFGGLTPPVDANGVTAETQVLDILANVPSGDQSNPEYSLDQLRKPTDEMLAGLDAPTLSPREFDQNLGLEPEKTTSVTPPEFDITDILDESRRMNKANILMQLGAGIAAGDVSKGLSAAGAAAASGAKEIRDLDMRSRLAKYQAGREDQKRETAASQFDRQMTLLEEKVRNAAKYGGSARDAAIIRVLGDEAEVLRQNLRYIDQEKEGGAESYRRAVDRLERLQETLYSLGGIKMPTGDIGGAGIVDFRNITGSQAIVGG